MTCVSDLRKRPTSKNLLGNRSKRLTGYGGDKKKKTLQDSSHNLYQYFLELTCGFFLLVCGLEVRLQPRLRLVTAQTATASLGRITQFKFLPTPSPKISKSKIKNFFCAGQKKSAVGGKFFGKCISPKLKRLFQKGDNPYFSKFLID